MTEPSRRRETRVRLAAGWHPLQRTPRDRSGLGPKDREARIAREIKLSGHGRTAAPRPAGLQLLQLVVSRARRRHSVVCGISHRLAMSATRTAWVFASTRASAIADLFAKAAETGSSLSGRLAQSLFRPTRVHLLEATPGLDLHPEAETAQVLAHVAANPPGIYVCAEPSGFGKTTIFERAATKVNGLKYISPHVFRSPTDYGGALLRHLGVHTRTDGSGNVFYDALRQYCEIVGRSAAVEPLPFDALQDRKPQKYSFALKNPVLVIDEAHCLFHESKSDFDDLIQMLREPACQRRTLRVILLSSQMDFAQVVRENVSGMSMRLRSFPMPRGSLGDLREHMLRQLQDKERMATLLRRYPQLRNAGEAEVDLWLGIAGDSLSSVAGFIESGVRTRADAELWLISETGILRASSSALLRALAAAGEDGSVPPGSEVVKVASDSPEDKDAQVWQRWSILRRDTDAEIRRLEPGHKFYTWNHATLRLSAALAFGKKFRPLDTAVPPVLPPVEAVPIAVAEDKHPVHDDGDGTGDGTLVV